MGCYQNGQDALPCAQQMHDVGQRQPPNAGCPETLHTDQQNSPVIRSASPGSGFLSISPQQMHPVQMLVPANDIELLQTTASPHETTAVQTNQCQPVVSPVIPTPLHSPTVSAAARQQHTGEGPTVSPAEVVLGSLPPPNTPESLQGCQVAHVNSTLKSLGLTAGDIQRILHNAAVYSNNNDSALPVA